METRLSRISGPGNPSAVTGGYAKNIGGNIPGKDSVVASRPWTPWAFTATLFSSDFGHPPVTEGLLILGHTWGLAGEKRCSIIDYICSNISYS